MATRVEDPFVRFAAAGVDHLDLGQAVINIGAVLGLLPIAGVPLPLVSYGGSALLPTMFALGHADGVRAGRAAARARRSRPRGPGPVARA